MLPFGWRALYAVGLVPLLVVAYLRRTLPETDRFDALARERSELRAAPPAGARAATWCAATRAASRCSPSPWSPSRSRWVPATFFAPKYLQDVHGWSPARSPLLNVVGGVFAIIGNPVAGWLSDRRGRRPVTVIFTVGVRARDRVLLLADRLSRPVLWIPLIFGLMGTQVTLGAYGAEMFPTSVRSTASGVREFCKTAGAVTGLAAGVGPVRRGGLELDGDRDALRGRRPVAADRALVVPGDGRPPARGDRPGRVIGALSAAPAAPAPRTAAGSARRASTGMPP